MSAQTKEPKDFPCTDSCSLNGQFNSTKWDLSEQQSNTRIQEDDEQPYEHEEEDFGFIEQSIPMI